MGRYYQTSKPDLLDYKYKLPIPLIGQALAARDQQVKNNQASLSNLEKLLDIKALDVDVNQKNELLKGFEDEIHGVSTRLLSDPNADIVSDIQDLSTRLHKSKTRGRLNAIQSRFEEYNQGVAAGRKLVEKSPKDFRPVDFQNLIQHTKRNLTPLEYDDDTGLFNHVDVPNQAKFVDLPDMVEKHGKGYMADVERQMGGKIKMIGGNPYIQTFNGEIKSVDPNEVANHMLRIFETDPDIKSYFDQQMAIGAMSEAEIQQLKASEAKRAADKFGFKEEKGRISLQSDPYEMQRIKNRNKLQRENAYPISIAGSEFKTGVGAASFAEHKHLQQQAGIQIAGDFQNILNSDRAALEALVNDGTIQNYEKQSVLEQYKTLNSVIQGVQNKMNSSMRITPDELEQINDAKEVLSRISKDNPNVKFSSQLTENRIDKILTQINDYDTREARRAAYQKHLMSKGIEPNDANMDNIFQQTHNVTNTIVPIETEIFPGASRALEGLTDQFSKSINKSADGLFTQLGHQEITVTDAKGKIMQMNAIDGIGRNAKITSVTPIMNNVTGDNNGVDLRFSMTFDQVHTIKELNDEGIEVERKVKKPETSDVFISSSMLRDNPDVQELQRIVVPIKQFKNRVQEIRNRHALDKKVLGDEYNADLDKYEYVGNGIYFNANNTEDAFRIKSGSQNRFMTEAEALNLLINNQ